MNTTHDQPTNDLERALDEITVWNGAQPHLWESALNQSERSPTTVGDRLTRLLHWNMPRALAASIAIVLVSAILLAVLLPSFGRTRSTAMMQHGLRDATAPRQMATAAPMSRDGYLNLNETAEQSGAGGALESRTGNSRFFQTWTADDQASNATGAPADRLVVKKATIELQTDDVRSVFLKASHLVSEASGEYVEQSSLTGEGPTAQANLTLRIAIERLDRVMNELRELAHVQSENLAGDDVTAQVVDLDARLRNEQRVETELLELLQKRTDAPLEDILQLREEISRVRQRIEQITAQQQRLSRLVSLATVLVIIRAEPTAAKDEEKRDDDATLRQYFGSAVADAWSGGMRFLADTLAGLIGVLIGGSIWWIALLAALLILRQHLRRRAGLV
jgi:hypothetical protein